MARSQLASVTIGGQRYDSRVRSVGVGSTSDDARYEATAGFAAPGAAHAGQAARVALP